MTTSTTNARRDHSTAGLMSFADATAAGQVLMWAPEGAGDFADVAWVIAGVLGNGAGVHSVEVQRLDNGSMYATVRVNGREHVRQAAEEHGWRLYAPDDSYATATSMLGEIHLGVIWLAPKDDESESGTSQLIDTTRISSTAAPASTASRSDVSGVAS